MTKSGLCPVGLTRPRPSVIALQMSLCRSRYWLSDKYTWTSKRNAEFKFVQRKNAELLFSNCSGSSDGLTERQITDGLPRLCHLQTRYFSKVKPGLCSAMVANTVCAKCSGWGQHSEAPKSDWTSAARTADVGQPSWRTFENRRPLLVPQSQWRTGGGGVKPPHPKFWSFDKAEPNSQFRGKYSRNCLVFLFHHPN
jgi:hypothetical protein